jgi:hypothetical protein
MLSGLRRQRLHTLSTVVWMRIYVEFTSFTIFLKQKLDLTKHVYDLSFFWIMPKLCQTGSKLQAMIWTWVQGTWIIRKGKENAFKSKSIKEAQSLNLCTPCWISVTIHPSPFDVQKKKQEWSSKKGSIYFVFVGHDNIKTCLTLDPTTHVAWITVPKMCINFVVLWVVERGQY